MEFIIVVIILAFIFEYTKRLDTRKFVTEVEPYFNFMMEEDYEFLAHLKYGADVDINILYKKRVKDATLVTVTVIMMLLFTTMNFISIIFAFIIGFVAFKSGYQKLQKYYKNNLTKINQMLPYYLKSLEILIQHYTVPVALVKSINSSPSIFKPGLRKLIDKIESGDSSVDPYMDFAKEYPVRDSMRMMRLLYRLSLGSQENKQQQLVMFSRNVSSLQNKMRENKYKDRLEKMEKMTMIMLMVTGGGILLILLFAMVSMLGI